MSINSPVRSNAQGRLALEQAYRQLTPGSARLAKSADHLLPDGISTDTRKFDPYGIYVERGSGATKWDVDGNAYLDFFGGHGALMLGHCPDVVTDAVCNAMHNGIQFAANHPGEILWAQAIARHVPSAERVRFVGSGTEATLLAIRMARAHTGRSKILRVATHYHGWHDAASVGYAFNRPSLPGLTQQGQDDIIVVMPNNLDQLRDVLAAHAHEIAGLIIEPLGSHFGIVPTTDAYLAAAYGLAKSHGLLVIFDEVITGFRVHPGGMQSILGLTPDLTCLAKVAAGGMPGGLVCGSAEVMSVLCQQDISGAPNPRKFLHQGTFTGNPVTAAAAVATIETIVNDNLCNEVTIQGEVIRARISELFQRLGLAWRVYGRYSAFHILPLNRHETQPSEPIENWPTTLFLARNVTILRDLRMALNLEGVDIAARGTAFVSAAHRASDVDRLIEALERAIKRLQSADLM